MESQYSTPENPGGQWVTRDGKTFFTPATANLTGRSFEDLQAYFQKYEPNATLVKFAGPPQASAGGAAQPQHPLVELSNTPAAAAPRNPFARLLELFGAK